MNVDFCNSKAFKINSDELREKVMVVCDNLFGISLKRGFFPGPQPVAIEKKNYPDLKKNEYMVCEKSDGERAILLLIHLNNKPMCFLLNRNNELYFMDLSFKKEVYEGTVMDGELIKTNGDKWNLLIHDCMIYNGTSFIEKSHRLRYACIIDFITKRYVNKETDCVNIKTKLFYKYGPGIDKTWGHIKKTTENNIDGLIFTPVNGPIKFGRDNFLFKWKLPENNTIDLLVKQKGKNIITYYTKNGNLVEFKKWTPTNENYKKIISFVPKITDLVIEFKILSEESFIPYKIRTDKSVPNSEITIFNTLKNIKEAITIDDLKASFLTTTETTNGCATSAAANLTSGCGSTNIHSGGFTASCTNSCGSTSAANTDSCGSTASTNGSGSATTANTNSSGSTASTNSSGSATSANTNSCGSATFVVSTNGSGSATTAHATKGISIACEF
jgi:mRNA guanylyltransferase